jgi:DNA-binding beta-propeller fold protein YncE
VVRHLVAGVLGTNPPPPLKAGSLEQSVEWDGKADYGKPLDPLSSSPLRVRVALGLGARYDKVVVSEPQSIGGVNSLAVGPDGTLYVVYSWGGHGPGWGSTSMVAFNRDGSYQRTIMPFPSNLKTDRVKGVGVVELDGRPAPLVKSIDAQIFWDQGFSKSGMAVTSGGQILYPLNGPRLGAVDGEGGIPWRDFAGPQLFGKRLSIHDSQRMFLAMAGDDKFVYLSGQGHCSQSHSSATLDNPYPAVFKVKLPERAPAEVVFGDMKATGNDETHLGGLPSGVAVDGKGHLLVGDPANKRVVVISEKDGKFVGSFPVEAPDCVAADPATGAVYVTRLTGAGGIELVKFSGWKDAAAVARASFPRDGSSSSPWVMALDPGAKPPVIWLGAHSGKLLRIEDLGGKFSDARQVNTDKFGGMSFLDMSVDRSRKAVFAFSNRRNCVRYEEGPGTFSMFHPETHDICQLASAPDGGFYALTYSSLLRRLNREGKPVPWTTGGKPDVQARMTGHILPHTLGMRPSDGHAFVFEVPPNGGGDNMLAEFGLDGKRVEGDPLIWRVSGAVVGPKFDAQGNIYIADQVKPAGQLYPGEFEGLKDAEAVRRIAGLYGGIVKFSPKGGMIDWPTGSLRINNRGLPKPAKLDPSLKVIDVVSTDYYSTKTLPAKVIGAEWVHMGISHVNLIYCYCENTRFDVDEFGRVFYPDHCRFRVDVLDTAGNEICHFGGYGNAESMGPESPVVDPKTGKVRPRRTDDPKDLKSPFAEPEIAFSWLVGVGATDQYAYMGDSRNRRLLRAKLVYAAEETCALP